MCITCVTSNTNFYGLFILNIEISKKTHYYFFLIVGYQIQVEVTTGLDRLREINHQQAVTIAVKLADNSQYLWTTINCGVQIESFRTLGLCADKMCINKDKHYQINDLQ